MKALTFCKLQYCLNIVKYISCSFNFNSFFFPGPLVPGFVFIFSVPVVTSVMLAWLWEHVWAFLIDRGQPYLALFNTFANRLRVIL